MLVQRVTMPTLGVESWTVLGDDDIPIEPIERFLAYLTDIDRSPNTVKAYAHDLEDYWIFLASRGLDWREVRLEDIGEYVGWLWLPPAGRQGAVAVLPSVEPHVGPATINRKLSALAASYAHQVRRGVDVGELLITWQLPGRRGGWKPFLHHISKDKPQPRRTIAVKALKKLPRVLTVTETQKIIPACSSPRGGGMSDAGRVMDGAERFEADAAARGLDVEIVEHLEAQNLAELADLLSIQPGEIVKSLVVKRHDGSFLFALIPGGRQISWPKLRAVVGVNKLRISDDEMALDATGYRRGVTPIGSTTAWPVVADERIVGRRIAVGAGTAGRIAFVDADALVAAYSATVTDISAEESPH